MDGGLGPRGVPWPDMNHRAKSHEDLKKMTDAAVPAASESIAAQWGAMGGNLQDAGVLLMQAVIGSESGWTGQAADAMRYRLGQVAEWSMTTGQGFSTASSSVREQSEAVGEAKTRMPDPVPYNPERMIGEALAGGLPGIIALPQQMYAQKQKHDAAYAEAITVVAARDAQLAASAATLPVFSPPPVLDDDVVEPGPGRPGPGGGGPGIPGGDGPNPGRGAAGPGAGVAGPDSFGEGGGGPDGPGSRPTTPSFGTTLPTLPEVPVGGPGLAGGTPGSASGTPGHGLGGGFLPVGGFGSGVGLGPDRAAGRGSPGGVGGSTGGEGARGTARGLGGAGRGPVAAGSGPGGAAAAEAAAGRSARGGAGLGGTPLGGGRGQGEEDTEHARPGWLVEENPESLFGTDQVTAPPVIGEE